ncbi:hypothetical protein JKV45_21415 [Pseudomonas aeruginosa]|uniref:hypothetical protein n=1 Tax=Pseudomonas aeruginosa TaxID=287 RepID=UPI001F21E0C2|nr:hypothetical protein [Pseudomonas aeruginosa]UJF37672.1 hypothetical protein JKV45_21415 [Pseudomonas aeruginosa]
MNQQERSGLLQSIGKYIKSQFSGYERRLELAEQKAAQALALDVDARIKLATIEVVKSATESMRAELAQAKQEAAEATKRANDIAESLRQPEDGKDADPEQIKQAVAEAVAKIPAPKDGKSVTLDDIRPIIDEAVKQLRADADSVFAETLDQAQQLRDGLAKSIAELRQPEDGKSFTAEDAKPIIDQAVADISAQAEERIDAAVSAAEKAAQDAVEKAASLRQPEDGKSVTIEDVRHVLDEAISESKQSIDVVVKQAQEAAQRASDVASSIRQPEDGKSVTLDDVRPVIEEAVKREVESLPRPQDGKSVTVDELRPVVVDEVRAAVSAIEIPKPRNGEDGRDALHLEILPAIDPEKSYPRGSYAKHAGGLWRAFEQTHGMRGWEVIVEGLTEYRIEQIDERTFEAVSVLSSGAEVRKSVSVPVVIDRGVFKAGSEYKSGDGVTWGGSYWIAQKDAPEGKPGEPGSEGWRLAVKKGRDGKDGKNGIDKTAPVRVEK